MPNGGGKAGEAGPRKRGKARRAAVLLTATILGGWAFIPCAAAQQTIFNVPSADVLPAGGLYLEGDALWRPGRGEDTFLTLRAVAGLGGSCEAGVNRGGLTTMGRSTPLANLALKWQPFHATAWSLTAGVHGQFFLRGGADGSPSGHTYAHAAWTPVEGTRITAGVWYGTSGYAEAGVTKGVLAGFERRLGSTLVFQADWYSGRSGLGYLTSGFAWTAGRWVVYAGYSVKNGDPHGNAALVEIGRYL